MSCIVEIDIITRKAYELNIHSHGYSLYNIHMYPYLILSVAPYFALKPYKSDSFLSTKPCQPTWNSKLGIINFFFWTNSLFVEISSTTLILVFSSRSSLYFTKHKDLSIDLWYFSVLLLANLNFQLKIRK